mmetsp:Transcript_107615/g.213812  ORF Transcript_107615/g.213812 Transcript_107615/m.213812 type:complete len:238 (+) Transcript_107615:1866-2579(+)
MQSCLSAVASNIGVAVCTDPSDCGVFDWGESGDRGRSIFVVGVHGYGSMTRSNGERLKSGQPGLHVRPPVGNVGKGLGNFGVIDAKRAVPGVVAKLLVLVSPSSSPSLLPLEPYFRLPCTPRPANGDCNEHGLVRAMSEATAALSPRRLLPALGEHSSPSSGTIVSASSVSGGLATCPMPVLPELTFLLTTLGTGKRNQGKANADSCTATGSAPDFVNTEPAPAERSSPLSLLLVCS